MTVGAADPADGTPAGSVEFLDTTTGVDLGIVALSGGGARLATTALAAGTHAIGAVISAAAPSPSAWARWIKRSPPAVDDHRQQRQQGLRRPLPTLTVTYTGLVNGDTPNSLSTRPSLGTTATASSPAGSYPITVGGAADPNYSISYVNGTLTINPDPTTTAVTSSASTANFGQTVTFKATVTANAPGSGTPSGTVDFFDTTTNTT